MGPTLHDLPVEAILEISRSFGATAVKVFGSRARGDARPDSDLDLLVEVVDGTSLFDLINMEGALAKLLGIRVEVVTMGALHPALKDDILREAKALHAAA